jgi:hypothetical protein
MEKIFLFFYINYYYVIRKASFFLQKILVFFISSIYFFEYIMIFFFESKNIYKFLLYKFIIKEFLIIIKEFLIIKNKKTYKKIQKNEKTKNIYRDKLLRIYYKRYRYYGFTVVYTQIFLRKLKELKNDIFFNYNYKCKKIYNNLKKNLINYTIFIYFANNYNLVVYLESLKKKIYIIFFFLSFLNIYNKSVLKNIFYSVIILFKKW